VLGVRSRCSPGSGWRTRLDRRDAFVTAGFGLAILAAALEPGSSGYAA
jgi:hypothetical protein